MKKITPILGQPNLLNFTNSGQDKEEMFEKVLKETEQKKSDGGDQIDK